MRANACVCVCFFDCKHVYLCVPVSNPTSSARWLSPSTFSSCHPCLACREALYEAVRFMYALHAVWCNVAHISDTNAVFRPGFCAQVTSSSLELHYHSKRQGLGALVEGMVQVCCMCVCVCVHLHVRPVMCVHVRARWTASTCRTNILGRE